MTLGSNRQWRLGQIVKYWRFFYIFFSFIPNKRHWRLSWNLLFFGSAQKCALIWLWAYQIIYRTVLTSIHCTVHFNLLIIVLILYLSAVEFHMRCQFQHQMCGETFVWVYLYFDSHTLLLNECVHVSFNSVSFWCI